MASVVVCRVEFQPGALGVLLQQALAFQAATYALADQLNPVLQLVFVRCLDALKAGRTIVATHVDAVQKQDMEVNIQVQCTTKTLNQRYGPGRALLERVSSLVDQVASRLRGERCSGPCPSPEDGQRTGTVEEREN